MFINFPTSPVEGDTYTFGSVKYKYTSGKWVTFSSGVNQTAQNQTPNFQMFKRLATEAGYNLVAGSFEEGATVTSSTDAVLQYATGKYYTWNTTGTVAASSVPDGTWTDVTLTTLRSSRAPNVGNAAQTFDVATAVAGTNAVPMTQAQSMINTRSGSAGAFSFRNKIVDGRFDFWYEGTSQTTSGYGSDTMVLNQSVGSTKVHSQQPLIAGVDLPTIDCPSAKYFSRTVVTSVAGAGNNVLKGFKIEDVSTLAGKVATLSFYAKADSTKNIGLSATQYFGSGGSAAVGSIGSQLVSLSTSWKRYSVQITFPSVSGMTIGTGDYIQIGIAFDMGSTYSSQFGGLGQQSGTFDIACVQLEEGSVATPFEELPIEISQTRIGRYYKYITPTAARSVCMGCAYNTTDLRAFIDFDSPMRISPLVSIPALSAWALVGGSVLTATAVTVGEIDPFGFNFVFTTSGLTPRDCVQVRLNAAAPIIADARL